MTEDKVDELFDKYDDRLSDENDFEVYLDEEDDILIRIYSDIDCAHIRRADYELLKEIFEG